MNIAKTGNVYPVFIMCGLYSRLTIHHKMILEGFCLLTPSFVRCPGTLNLYCFSQAKTIKVHRHGNKGRVASVFSFSFLQYYILKLRPDSKNSDASIRIV